MRGDVLIGGDGLTAAVQKEVDAALNAHGLIKVACLGACPKIGHHGLWDRVRLFA